MSDSSIEILCPAFDSEGVGTLGGSVVPVGVVETHVTEDNNFHVVWTTGDVLAMTE